jgi:conjugative relaxase-like TrwC/TraI family protein
MMTISAVKESGGASRYYSQDNYYTEGENVERSQWMGKGAELLQLEGGVDPHLFEQLLSGMVDGEQLGRVTKDGVQHRPGWDLTFSAPKSVSILSEVFELEAVREAHQQAVAEALAYVEKNYLETRVSVNGETIRWNPKNGIFATFTHDVSRELDPQLHTHAVLVNATKTPNGWRSIANEKLHDREAIMAGGMAYRMALATKMTELGFTLKQHRDPRLWEIEGVPDSLMDEFSKRSSQIKRYFEERGLPYDSAFAKQVALKTRRRKEAVPREELMAIWKERIEGHSVPEHLLEMGQGLHHQGGGNSTTAKTIRDAVTSGINHLLETNMGFTDEELEVEAMRLSLGKGRLQELKVEIKRLKKAGRLVEAKLLSGKEGILWTTREAKQAEERLINFVFRAKDACKALADGNRVEKRLSRFQLNEQQKAAVLHSLRSTDRFTAIQGDPGVGKTHTLKAYRQLLSKSGYDVIGLAPSYQAVQELSSSLSVQGLTVDRFLVDPKIQEQSQKAKKQVWIVDEAGMLDTAKTNRLMARAEQANARVLFVGDDQQLESVGAGRAFKQMQAAGISVAIMDQRMRQKTEEMVRVVDYVMAKRYAEAFEAMAEARQIVTAYDKNDRNYAVREMAADYLSRSPDVQANTLVVTPTNEQRNLANYVIREGLIEQGVVRNTGVSLPAFDDVRMGEQEKKMVEQYKTGQVVRFNYQYRDPDANWRINRHDYFEIVGRKEDENILALKSLDNEKAILYINPKQVGGDRPGGIQVYRKNQVELGEGDRLRWLDNGNKEGLKRNDELVVDKILPDRINLKGREGKSVQLTPSQLNHRHFEYDYARTAYGVQGKTNKEVLAVMDSWRRNTVHQRSFMVAVTRASHDARIYVDSPSKVLKALGKRHGDNTEALTTPEFTRATERENIRKQNQPRRSGVRQLI